MAKEGAEVAFIVMVVWLDSWMVLLVLALYLNLQTGFD